MQPYLASQMKKILKVWDYFCKDKESRATRAVANESLLNEIWVFKQTLHLVKLNQFNFHPAGRIYCYTTIKNYSF